MKERNGAIESGHMRVPVTHCPQLQQLLWWHCKLRAMERGDPGIVVVEGVPWMDISELPDASGGLGPTPEACELLSAAGAKAADIVIFAKRLRQQLEGEVERFLKEQREGP